MSNNYIYINIKSNLNTNTLEHGSLIGLKKTKEDELFLILLINKHKIKLFNLKYFSIIDIDAKLELFEYKINYLENKLDTDTILNSILDILNYMKSINFHVTNELINIDFYTNNLNTKTIKQHSLYVIKRNLPLLTDEKFKLLYNKAHNLK